MSFRIGDDVLEEGEIEDEDDDVLPHFGVDGGKNRNESASPVVADCGSDHYGRGVGERRHRHSYAPSPPRQLHRDNFMPPQRPHEQILPPLTKGGYWAPPPLFPMRTQETSPSPGSRVFHYLRNRSKSSESSSDKDNREKGIRKLSSESGSKPGQRRGKSTYKQGTRQKQQDGESDFQNLLRKHKEIQEQLARLYAEERVSGSDKQDGGEESLPKIDSNVNGEGNSAKVISSVGLTDQVECLEDLEVKEGKRHDVVKPEPNDVIVISPENTSQNPETTCQREEDDDLDALELRRLALESFVNTTSSRDSPRVKTSSDNSSYLPNSTTSSSKTTRAKSQTGKPSVSPRKMRRAFHNNRTHGRQTRRGDSKGSQDRKMVTPRETIDRYGRQRRLRKTATSNHRETSRRMQEDEQRQRQADRLRAVDRRKQVEDKQKLERKRQEIQQILSLNDQEEQVERFLKLMKGEMSEDQNSRVLSKKATVKIGQAEFRSSQQMLDNYDEVAMEIDSDSPVMPSIEDFHKDLSMGFMGMPPLPNTAIPSLDNYQVPSFPDLQMLTEWQMKIWNPPLPPEDSAAPPPPPVPPPPSPPAPPLPDEPCPESGAEVQEETDEESLLREQLLKSMAVKKTKLVSETKSGTSTPLSGSSPVPSPKPQPTQKPLQKTKAQKVHRLQLPVQKPVVIRLGDSTDESGEEGADEEGQSVDQLSLLGGLDSFLKQVRKSVDLQKQAVSNEKSDLQIDQEPSVSEEAQLQHAHVRQMEDTLATLRKETLKEQSSLKNLLEQLAKYLSNQKQAEAHVKKIREQLTAVEKIAVACGRQAQTLKLQVRDVRKSVKEKLLKYRLLEEEVLTKGLSVFGGSYTLPVQLVSKKTVKRKAKDSVIPGGSYRASSKKVLITDTGTGSPKPKMSETEIALEKTRLQKLEQEYAQKIKLLKYSQTNSKRSTGNLNRLKQKQLVEIPRLDKIELGEVGEIPDQEHQPSRRRQSLLDLNSSTKPNILTEEKVGITREEKESSVKKKDKKFILPEGQQLRNLCKLVEEKVDKVLTCLPVPTESRFQDSARCDCFFPPVEQILCVEFDPQSSLKSNLADELSEPSCLSYHSPLLHFKSYRLSRYYRTKERLQLSSVTYSNKIHPQKEFCRFELQGKCKDVKCLWQHEADYTLTQRELLTDIVSYCPSLAGVEDTTDVEEYRAALESFVERTESIHSKCMTPDQLSVLMVSHVRDKCGLVHPQNVLMKARAWRPAQTNKSTELIDSVPQDNIRLTVKENIRIGPRLTTMEMDHIIGDHDERYFLDGQAETDLETAVTEDPNNIQLWLTLAHRKLLQSDSSELERLDLCLNVLARALEANRTSCELWYNYLKVYAHHVEANDMLELCRTALACAPSYQIWGLYLNEVSTFLEKEAVCKELVVYLLNSEEDNKDKRSFQILESVIHLVCVYVQSGRYKTGLVYLQAQVQGEESPSDVMKRLVSKDRCILCLTFVYLSQFHQLPPSLFNPVNQNPGRIVSRVPFQLPWRQHPDLQANVASILDMLWKTLSVCSVTSGDTWTNADSDRDDNSVVCVCSNIITVQQLYISTEEARKTCHTLLQSYPDLPDLWAVAARVELNSGQISTALKMIEEGVEAHPHCARLYYSAANLYLTQGDSDGALRQLEQSVIALYDVDVMDSKTCDPNLLYCKTLDQPVPLNYRPPPFVDQVTNKTVQDQIADLWLNYCLLLEVQGDPNQAVESYETALGLLYSHHHLGQLWKGYIQFHQRQMAGLSAEDKQVKAVKLTSLVKRCLTSFPVKREVSPGLYWMDFTDQNEIMEVYLRSVPVDGQLAVYRQLVQAMPNNVDLAIRAIEHAVRLGDYVEAGGLCNSVLLGQVANIRLWKLAICVSYKLKNYREVERLYRRAVRKLPLMFTLWKDYLLFEVTQRCETGANWITEQCQQLGVNIKGFVATVSKLQR